VTWNSPEALFAATLQAQPSRPLITFYDDASGERSELSAKSMANWVAKTHFLLTDELGLGVGDRALIALPAHWITVAVLFGCWSAGLRVETTGEQAAVAFVEPATVTEATGVPDVFAIAPLSAAIGFRGAAPPGVQDYVDAVRPQADSWAGVHPTAGPSDPAIGALTRADVIGLASKRAAELGLAPGGRVLSERRWSDSSDWIDTLLAPLTVSASVVLVANAYPVRRDRRIEQEQVTTVI
jgi:uncharacterized protein (TIGR03089 family)